MKYKKSSVGKGYERYFVVQFNKKSYYRGQLWPDVDGKVHFYKNKDKAKRDTFGFRDCVNIVPVYVTFDKALFASRPVFLQRSIGRFIKVTS